MEWLKMTMDNDSQGSFQPSLWCDYIPNWGGIEALRSAMNTNTITALQSAIMIYSYPTDTNNIVWISKIQRKRE